MGTLDLQSSQTGGGVTRAPGQLVSQVVSTEHRGLRGEENPQHGSQQ